MTNSASSAAAAETPADRPPWLRTRLSVMMFLEFFVWGIWFVPMFVYLTELGFADGEIGLCYSTTGIAALVSPFLVGMIADRYFATQRVLAALHLIGAVLLYFVAQADSFGVFFPLLLGYTICYMPTLALVNSVSFENMTDPEREFPPVRTLGTIGWIVSGLFLGSSFFAAAGGYEFQFPEFLSGKVVPEAWTSISATNVFFLIAAGASALLGLYCLSLPHTPPQLAGKEVTVGEIFGLKALRLMKDRSFAVFVICSFLVCIPLAFYYQTANGFLKAMEMDNSEWKMTYGQFSEIFFLLLMPFFFKKFGVKNVLLIGMLAWVLRYVAFANAGPGDATLLYIGILLHGICYDFFFVTGQLYVDKRAPRDIRASAQGFIALVTLGAGMMVGGWINGWWNGRQTGAEGKDWEAIWYFPAAGALIVLIVFAIFFKDRTAKAPA